MGGLGWLPPHSAARESTTQLAWVQLSLVAAAWLARAATSSTALHWVESRHCTALHCTSIMILQNIFQLDKPCCSECNAKFTSVTILCKSEIITWTLDKDAIIRFSKLLRNDEQCQSVAADQNVTLQFNAIMSSIHKYLQIYSAKHPHSNKNW